MDAYPPYLLSGAMVCGHCGCSVSLISGRHGGYYGCSKAVRRACDNRVRVRRQVAENVILGALRDRILQPDPVSRVLDRVREEITALSAHVPDMLKGKRAQLAEARRRVARIVNFVALGRAQDSTALAEALVETEASVTSLEVEVESLEQTSASRVRFPSRAWIEKRLAVLRELLERRTEASGLLLRRLLGGMVLEPVYPDGGRPYYVARTAIDVLVLLESPGSDPSPEPGASSFGWWTRNERTRTFARLPFELDLRDSVQVPVYQRLAGPAAALRAAGRSDRSIAVEFGVSDKTIAKAVRWFRV